MAVTKPGFYRFDRGDAGIYYPKDVLAADVEQLRANAHELYAGVGLRAVTSHLWPAGLLTSETSAQTVLEIPLRLATDRTQTDGILCMFRRTGTCTVTFILRNAADDTTIDSSSNSAAAGAYAQELDPDGNSDLLLRVQLHVSSGTEGLSYLRVCETQMAAGDLP